MIDHAQGPILQVFAKEPRPGQVKTRLARTLGDDQAAAIYRELTATTLRHAVAARDTGVVCSVELWCAPSPNSTYFATLATSIGATLHAQGDGDLGVRMSHAIGEALTRAGRVLLIGSDCAVLDPPYLALAARCLDKHDAVLGPAEDGGYVLIGARVPVSLADVRWSTRHALADTAAAFAHQDIRWTAAPVLWDVDQPDDLARWNALRATAKAAP